MVATVKQVRINYFEIFVERLQRILGWERKKVIEELIKVSDEILDFDERISFLDAFAYVLELELGKFLEEKLGKPLPEDIETYAVFVPEYESYKDNYIYVGLRTYTTREWYKVLLTKINCKYLELPFAGVKEDELPNKFNEFIDDLIDTFIENLREFIIVVCEKLRGFI